MRKAALIFILAISGLSLTAQSNGKASREGSSVALPADAATREQVMTLMDTMRVRSNMIAMVGNMKQMMSTSLQESFAKKIPNPTPKQKAALQGMVDDALNISVDEILNATIQIYQRHLTRTDVEELIRFYSSPVGQKLLREQPELMRESMQAALEIQRKRMDEMTAKIDERAKQLAEDEQNPAPPSK